MNHLSGLLLLLIILKLYCYVAAIHQQRGTQHQEIA